MEEIKTLINNNLHREIIVSKKISKGFDKNILILLFKEKIIIVNNTKESYDSLLFKKSKISELNNYNTIKFPKLFLENLKFEDKDKILIKKVKYQDQQALKLTKIDSIEDYYKDKILYYLETNKFKNTRIMLKNIEVSEYLFYKYKLNDFLKEKK